MSIKTNNAMAALLRNTDVPDDVVERLSAKVEAQAEPEPKPEPVAKREPEPTPAEKPQPRKPVRRAATESPRRQAARSGGGMNVGMDDVHRGEGVKQFTLRMPVTMWARLKLLSIRAQLSGQGAKSQQEMILSAVEGFLEDNGCGDETDGAAAALAAAA